MSAVTAAEAEEIRALALEILRVTQGNPLPRRLAALTMVAGGLIGATGLPLASVDVMVSTHRGMVEGFARNAMLDRMTGEEPQ